MNLSANCQFRVIKSYQGAGTSPFTSDVIDTQGFDGCLLLGKFSASNAGNYFKAAEDDAVGLGTKADLLGTKIVPDHANCMAVIDIYKPIKRYLAMEAVIGSSAALEFMIAILYNGRNFPVDNIVTSTVISELHISPIAGTA